MGASDKTIIAPRNREPALTNEDIEYFATAFIISAKTNMINDLEQPLQIPRHLICIKRCEVIRN